MSRYRPEKRKSPCSECPFRRTSTRGWLGADNPEHFVEQTLRGADMPCHMDIDYSDKEWMTTQEPDAPMCVGALQFQNNWLSLSRNPKVAEAQRQVGNNVNVFDSPEQFMIHHKWNMHFGPVEPSFLFNAHKVNLANGFTEIAKVERIGVRDFDGGIYVAYNDGTKILNVAVETGEEDKSPLSEVEWLREFYQDGGQIEYKWVDAAQFAFFLGELSSITKQITEKVDND
jgi:hypothetical protein